MTANYNDFNSPNNIDSSVNYNTELTTPFSFDIRDFLDQLTPNPKEKGKYICPNCNSHNLSVNLKNGKFNCWNCEDTKAITRELTKDLPQSNQALKSNNVPPKPLHNIEIATQPIPDDIPEKVFAGRNQFQTIYPYSQSQRVERLDSNNGTKKCIPHHLDSRGCDIAKKGSDQWFPYRIEDISAHGRDKYPLLLEGEQCVESARGKGLVAATFLGSEWTDKGIEQGLQALKDNGIAGLVMWPDNDKPGFDKARKVKEIGDRIGLKVIVLDPLSIWREMPEKGDIVDFLEVHPSISRGGVINRLKLASELQPQKPKTETITPEPEQELPASERLELALNAYLLETDKIAKALMLSQICRNFSLSKSTVENLLLAVDASDDKNKLREYKGSEIFNSDIKPVQFAVRGVPKGGTTIFAGTHGTGKTTLIYWLGKCVLTGDEFLGASPSVSGPVIIVNSDEGSGSALDRFIDMDYPAVNSFRYLTNFNIDRDFERLEKLTSELQPPLIIVDSFCGIQGAEFDENSSLAGLSVQRFNKLAEAYDCAVVVIHHYNKNEKLRGSSRIGDIAHSILTIELNKDGSRQFKSKKIRGATPFDLTIGLKDDIFPYVIAGGDNKLEKSNKDQVLDILISNSHLEPVEIVNQIGLSNQQVWKALKSLKDDGKVGFKRHHSDKRRKIWFATTTTILATPLSPQKNNGEDSKFYESYTEKDLQPQKNTILGTIQDTISDSKDSTLESKDSIQDGQDTIHEDEDSIEDSIINPSLHKDYSENTILHSENQGGEGVDNTTPQYTTPPEPTPEQQKWDSLKEGDVIVFEGEKYELDLYNHHENYWLIYSIPDENERQLHLSDEWEFTTD